MKDEKSCALRELSTSEMEHVGGGNDAAKKILAGVGLIAGGQPVAGVRLVWEGAKEITGVSRRLSL